MTTPHVCVSFGIVQTRIPKSFSKYSGIPAISSSPEKHASTWTSPTALNHHDRQKTELWGDMSTKASQSRYSLGSRYLRVNGPFALSFGGPFIDFANIVQTCPPVSIYESYFYVSIAHSPHELPSRQPSIIPFRARFNEVITRMRNSYRQLPTAEGRGMPEQRNAAPPI